MILLLSFSAPCAVRERNELNSRNQRDRNSGVESATGSRGGLWIAMLIVIWIVAIVAAYVVVARYEQTSGAIGSTRAWPSGAALRPSATRLTLLVFIHPRCPCTRASLAELTNVLRDCGDRVQTCVIACDLARDDPDWRVGATLTAAGRLPSCTVAHDPTGTLARAFGAETSGLVALYAPNGSVLYWGGVTPSRGMIGVNPGARALRRAIAGDTVAISMPVFGCPLTHPE